MNGIINRNISTVLSVACIILALALPATVIADSPPESLPGGCVYRDMTISDGPWAVQVLEIPRSSKRIEVGVTLGDGAVLGIIPVDDITRRMSERGRRPLAVVNGDFFILEKNPFQGDPIGLCVEDGELVSSPIGRAALVFRSNGSPVIGRFSLDAVVKRPDGATFPVAGINQHCPDDAIVVMTPAFADSTRPQDNAASVTAGGTRHVRPGSKLRLTVREENPADRALPIPDDAVVLIGRGKGCAFIESVHTGDRLDLRVALTPSAGSIAQALGGGPRLLRKGDVSIEAKEEGIGESFVTARHPRTAFGYNAKKLFLVTVDGRQPGYSVGMSLPELAGLMKKLGATEAVNLDGGGSTTMWVNGSVRNRPSDGRLRPIGNAIVVYEKEGK